jgi:tetratricopeptide (TPR) repeat protein
VLVGLAGVVLVAVLWMAVAVPAVAAVKASYGLIALVPFSVFGAHALDRAAGLRRWAMPVVAAAVGSWALAAFSTYWIDGASAEARLALGVEELAEGDARERGAELVAEAVRLAPDSGAARGVLAWHLLHAGGAPAEIQRLLAAGSGGPGATLRLVTTAGLAHRQGDLAHAEEALRVALALAPDLLQAHMQLASLRASAGDPASAVRELREALRIDPQHAAAHAALARVYGALGDPAAASMHGGWAERLKTAR